ncbi:MAG: S-methyl-5'-thioinosine phosphorylase [Gammaproteobacteria bacterium]|nr:S-methyl-5'-thioinosine phosphorylase [Gammaproteobacteria bacterium]
MKRVGIVGGTGLAAIGGVETGAAPAPRPETPYGAPSAVPERGSRGGVEVVFLQRHGRPRSILPHRVNYRANLWLLHSLGVDAVIAAFTVGGLAREYRDADLVVPHQLIDYTHGRADTFAAVDEIRHVDFTEPFDATLRSGLVAAGERCALRGRLHAGGVYGCTQGPRLETAAEVDRLERDGCTVVGMTAMPEAVLARELGLPYAGVCLVVNPAAGRGDGPITAAGIQAAVDRGAADLALLLETFLDGFDEGG